MKNFIIREVLVKEMARNHIAPLNFLPLLHFCPGGVRKELDV
jgi:hypothetical protein